MNAMLMTFMVDSRAVDSNVASMQTSGGQEGGFDELLAGMTTENTNGCESIATGGPHATPSTQKQGTQGRAGDETVPQNIVPVVASDEAVPEGADALSLIQQVWIEANTSPETLQALPADMPVVEMTELPEEARNVAARLTAAPRVAAQTTMPLETLPEDEDNDELMTPQAILSRLAVRPVSNQTAPGAAAAEPSEPQPQVQPHVQPQPTNACATRTQTSADKPASAEKTTQNAASLAQAGEKTETTTSREVEPRAETVSNPSKTLTEADSRPERMFSGERTGFEREFDGRGREPDEPMAAVTQQGGERVVTTRAETASETGPKAPSSPSVAGASSTQNAPDAGRDGSAEGNAFNAKSNAAESTSGPDRSRPDAAASMDVERLADRMVRFVRANVSHDRSSIEMRLNPPELGSLRMSMTIERGQVNLSLQTMSETARDTIAQNVGQLRQSLMQHGFEVGRLDVSMGQTFAQSQTTHQEDGRQSFTGGYRPVVEAEPKSEETLVTVSRRWSRHLDLVA